MEVDALPHVDEHATAVAAGVDEVWRALTETLDRAYSRPGWARYARLVGCADRTAAGPRPLAVGSVFPGFRVVGAVPGGELVLRGSHRFSAYAFVFRLDELAPGRTRLRAETRAVFPGPAGAVYRLLVIGSGGHAAGVRRLLAGIRRRAE
ncbi:hypothetical protein [Streptomyces hokutonensis]|uniref:hypothetical protein n=1 Tax=Streptomyces hokutonensis TaxID=1306990 RepID=UPI0033EC5DAB